jgi:hypothetical protein
MTGLMQLKLNFSQKYGAKIIVAELLVPCINDSLFIYKKTVRNASSEHLETLKCMKSA